MAAQLIFALYFAAVALTLGMAIYCRRAAWDQTRPWMPAPLQDRISTAFDGFIWGGGVPDAARRNYLRAQLFVCVAGTLMTIVAFLSVALKGMLWFGGLTAFFVIRTLQFWLRYRRLHAASIWPRLQMRSCSTLDYILLSGLVCAGLPL